MTSRSEVLAVAGREVTVTNPDKVFFADADGGPITKLELVRYYVAVADGALRGAAGRPMALKRFPNGAAGDFFFQKRAPDKRPDFVRTVELSFPSGRTADEIVVDDAAALAWVVNLGCIDLNPHPVRADDLDHPDELRVDLDPVPGVPWDDVRRVALVVRDALADVGLVGWPKTSGNRGIHVNVRIAREWTFPEVRRAALALARDVERRVPDVDTSKWWKEERRRLHRLQPERQGSHRRLCLLRPARRTPRVSMRSLGRGRGVSMPRPSPAQRGPAGSPVRATARRHSTRPSAASTVSSSSPPDTRRRGRRRPLAAQLRSDARRAAPRQPSKRRMSTKP